MTKKNVKLSEKKESDILTNLQPVLDKGHVSCISSTNTGKELERIQSTYFGTDFKIQLLRIANATFIVKMPIFVHLNISRFNLEIIPITDANQDAYLPNISEIECDDLDKAREISEYMATTTEALILNSKGMTMDGCNKAISQTQMPVSMYTTALVHGSLHNWLLYIKQKDLPKPVEAYRFAIEQLLKADWKTINSLKKIITI